MSKHDLSIAASYIQSYVSKIDLRSHVESEAL